MDCQTLAGRLLPLVAGGPLEKQIMTSLSKEFETSFPQ